MTLDVVGVLCQLASWLRFLCSHVVALTQMYTIFANTSAPTHVRHHPYVFPFLLPQNSPDLEPPKDSQHLHPPSMGGRRGRRSRDGGDLVEREEVFEETWGGREEGDLGSEG